ncbi:MAG: sigma-54-dependent Fis family transcriptional regulator [Deltaproteobacteria bacterium]|nr:sigma-54-dependent Fis family transcriptional regulator [Candidatus Anaeroferrophillus wilburensis]MBN2889337.1 sigma-54-dependent Fis family transcriptional regulator [Deltaproteobacteria bacterium]
MSGSGRGSILVVDDNSSLRESLAAVFHADGFLVDQAEDGMQAVDCLVKTNYDVVITDIKMPKVGGLDVLKEAKKLNATTVVIIMTGYGTVESAVEAMKLGAFDYLQKPFSIEEMQLRVVNGLRVRDYEHELTYLRGERNVIYNFDNFIGQSASVKKVFATLKKVSRSNASVLITGETGTGKELVAGAVHYSSQRSSSGFVKVNCAALHENLLESELFGHEKGAYTGAMKQRIGRFEQAHRGTLFLDEIGDMTLSTQAKVLRVIQEKEFERLGGNRTIKVDVRILSATNKDLSQAVQDKQFREDLFFRLNVITIRIPSLRERKDDIPLLASFFLKKFSGDLKKHVRGISPGAVSLLQRYQWPGNVRELENCIERAVLMCEGTEIKQEDLFFMEDMEPRTSESLPLKMPPEGIQLKEMEEALVVETLKMCNWIQKDAAKMLGISKRVMNYKVKQYNLSNPRWIKNK